MKAAIVEEPGKFSVKEIPKPEVGNYGVLCKMLYGATCTGTDTHIIDGTIPFHIDYPTILGHESIGRVIEVGKKVKYFKPGDLVTRVGTPPIGDYAINWGGFAEMGLARDHWAMCQDGLPREQWDQYRVNQILPTGIDAAAATMIITWRETLSYLTRMGVSQGDSVLVIGSGGNGLAYASHAVNKGCSSVVMIGNIKRQDAGEKIGAAGYFDYKDEEVINKIQEEYPEGFDYIIDAVGKEGQMDQALPLLKQEGTVGIYGLDDADSTFINPRKAGVTFSYYNNNYDEEETHHQVLTYMKRGQLDADIWLDFDNIYPLEEINEAFAAVRERKMVKALIEL